MHFFFAIEENNLLVVKFFIEKGIDVNISDDQYQTLLIHAVKRDRVEICHYLIKEGANPFSLDSCNNMAIDYAKSARIRALLESL
jgi:ankyrin repeat protein